ncbi:MAG: leucyl aminopeptidase [Planctomycetota bacterium]
MKLTFQDRSRPLARTALLVVPALAEEAIPLPPGVTVPRHATADFKADFRESRLADAVAGPAQRVLVVGLGKRREVDAERVRRLGALAAKRAEKLPAARAAIWLPARVEKAAGGPEEAGQAIAEGVTMGAYACSRFKSDAKKPKLLRVTAIGSGAAFRHGGERGVAIGAANVFARDLQDAPGNLMRPRDLAAAARRVAGRSPRIRCRVLGEAQMARLGMGSLLSVSKGSVEPAFLVHLVYRPRRRARGRLAVVGKGLTFDAGGISLKPPAKMHEMKYDMSGGAAVIGLFHALGDLDFPFEVHGFVPTSENLPDGKANKPGDVVRAMNGKTIEVLNTDAEGRLILADALAYAASKVEPDTIVDLATLTGAVVVALGHELTGVLGNDEKLAAALVAAGKACGELVWPLPLLEAHKKQMKSKVADLRNVNSGEGGGAIAGAAFLANFVGDIPWAHLDIAGTAWDAEERDYQGGSWGTGVGVRLLVEYLRARSGE